MIFFFINFSKLTKLCSGPSIAIVVSLARVNLCDDCIDHFPHIGLGDTLSPLIKCGAF